jgi:protein SCO1
MKHKTLHCSLSCCVVLLALLLLSLLSGCAAPTSSSQKTSQSSLQGTGLSGTPAPGFHLVDQYGKSVSLSQFKGMPVILTFFYTHCPNYCPLIAQKIHTALDLLDKNAGRVAILGISVDPEHDTQADAQSFSTDHGLASAAHWHYLLGTRAQLSPIWSAYAVQGLPPSVRVISTSQMIHSSVVYLIDQQGREQALLDYDFTPTELAHDVTVLLGL